MNGPGDALAEAALGLVGCPFRLYGREPDTGLDCVGLVSAALAASGAQPVVPTGYGLRNLSVDLWLPLAERSGLEPSSGLLCAGDVLAFPAGEENGHHLHNRTDQPCIFVAIGAGERETDSGVYSDIDMVFGPDGYARKDGTRYDSKRLA